jgi:hypothetical protein
MSHWGVPAQKGSKRLLRMASDEETEDHGRIQLRQRQGRGGLVRAIVEVAEEEAEGTAVAGEAAGAGLSLSHEAFEKEIPHSAMWSGFLRFSRFST